MCGGGLQGTRPSLLNHPLGQLTVQVSRDAGIRHDHDTLRIGDKEVEDRGDLSSRNTPKEFVIRVFRGRYLQRARLFDPSCKKLPQIAVRYTTEHTLKIAPADPAASILLDQHSNCAEKPFVTDFTSQHMKNHRGLVVPDGVISGRCLPLERRNRIILVWRDIQGVIPQHHFSLVPRLLHVTLQFVPVVVRKICRQPFNPVPAVIIKDMVPDP